MSEQQNDIQNENNGMSQAELQKQRNIQNNANNIRNAADVAIASKNPYGVAIGGAVKAADKLSGGRTSEQLGKTMNNMSKFTPQGRRMQALSNKLNESGASDMIGKAAATKNAADGKSSAAGASNGSKGKKLDSEKSLKQRDAEDQEKSFQSGTFNAGFKRATLVKLGLFCSILCFWIVFFIAVLSTIADNEGKSIVMGEMVGNDEDRELIKDIYDETHDEYGEGNSDEVGMGVNSDSVNTDKELEERFKLLGNVFSSENIKCEGEECFSRPEFRYYLKVADIAYRYKKKYGINLDWILLNATVQYNDMTQEAIMTEHMHDYDLDAVEDIDKLMDLDWDYDYTKISGYTYLDPDDYRYDLQILAKNMVAKTTTQQCIKKTKDAEGNVSIEKTKEQIDQDIEEQYFKPGQEYYLKCASGEEYSIFSIYKLDQKKYEEFLLEYLEHKFYLEPNNHNGNNNNNSNSFTCLFKEFTKYDLTDEQLEKIASLAYHEQGTAKGAAAEASLMANLFELKGSSYGSGADGLYNYVRNSGWFANSEKNMDSKDASPEIIAAVKSVLVDGKRTLPGYIDEHDWINDLTSVTNDGKSINKKDRDKYEQFKTIIKNKYGATYTFYSFPDTNSDPFGYTSETNREEIGDFHFDYDTGNAMNCSSSGFIFPLPACSGASMTSPFGYRIRPGTTQTQFHKGVDYGAPGGTPVYAIADGTVIASGTGCKVGNKDCNGQMGNYVKIEHADGVQSIYMHATDVYVQTGQQVTQGTTIMTVGTTGYSTGNHLHIGIYKDGNAVDPVEYIGQIPSCN